jgi:hypothetical protein
MTEAPERIWMDPDIKFPECEKQYGCDVEYIRKDVSDALVAAAREEALREAAEVAAEEANWVPHKSDDFRKAILALIEKDQ